MRIFSWSLILVLSLLLSACGQKGPLTLPNDEPPDAQTDEQVPPGDETQATEDNGVDDHGENDGAR